MMYKVDITYQDGETEQVTCEEVRVENGVLKLWGPGGSYSRRRDHVAIPLTSIRRYEVGGR